MEPDRENQENRPWARDLLSSRWLATTGPLLSPPGQRGKHLKAIVAISRRDILFQQPTSGPKGKDTKGGEEKRYPHTILKAGPPTPPKASPKQGLSAEKATAISAAPNSGRCQCCWRRAKCRRAGNMETVPFLVPKRPTSESMASGFRSKRVCVGRTEKESEQAQVFSEANGKKDKHRGVGPLGLFLGLARRFQPVET